MIEDTIKQVNALIAEWKALPAPVRSWLIRVCHGAANVIATGLTTYQTTSSWRDSIIVAAVSALIGQAALSHQLPRDPAAFVDRASDEGKPE